MNLTLHKSYRLEKNILLPLVNADDTGDQIIDACFELQCVNNYQTLIYRVTSHLQDLLFPQIDEAIPPTDSVDLSDSPLEVCMRRMVSMFDNVWAISYRAMISHKWRQLLVGVTNV